MHNSMHWQHSVVMCFALDMILWMEDLMDTLPESTFSLQMLWLSLATSQAATEDPLNGRKPWQTSQGLSQILLTAMYSISNFVTLITHPMSTPMHTGKLQFKLALVLPPVDALQLFFGVYLTSVFSAPFAPVSDSAPAFPLMRPPRPLVPLQEQHSYSNNFPNQLMGDQGESVPTTCN
jgi:hypothetical protein